MDDRPLPILEHLRDLRARLIVCVITVAAFSLAGYRFTPFILKSLAGSAGRLVFINPTEAFWVNIKIALAIGVYLSLPVIFYQAWRFVSLGLGAREKRYVVYFTLLSFALFNIGAVFCYFLIVPLGMKFLLSYSQGVIEPMLSVNSYLSFLVVMVMAFGIIFELPLAVGFLAGAGLVSPQGLIKYRRLAIVGIFIAAAVFTPPDAFTQICLALPLLVLYELSILIAKRVAK